MRAPKKSSFTSEEICRILESCKSAGVKEFRLGDLSLSFHLGEVNAVKETLHEGLPPVIDHAAQEKEALERDEEFIKKERLALLLVEDPEEYERQISDGELLTDGSDDEEDT